MGLDAIDATGSDANDGHLDAPAPGRCVREEVCPVTADYYNLSGRRLS
jgi:hypothetical protein